MNCIYLGEQSSAIVEKSRSGETLLPLYKCNHPEVGGDVLIHNCRDGVTCCKDCPFKELPPTTAKKIKNFTKAVIGDIKNKGERCTQEEINQRMDICRECPFYVKTDNTKGRCSKCGCPVSQEKIYLNKLHWKSQKCPVDKW